MWLIQPFSAQMRGNAAAKFSCESERSHAAFHSPRSEEISFFGMTACTTCRIDFVSQRFVTAPEFHCDLARELWTLLREIGRDGRKVNGKTLHDHQFTHLIWTAAAPRKGPTSPTSFFIQEAPGTGKTLTLGVLMQACIRLQTRGLLTGKNAYCTAKSYYLSDKVRGQGMGQRRVLRLPPYPQTKKGINRLRLALYRMDGEFMKSYLPKRHGPDCLLTAQRPKRRLAEQSKIISGKPGFKLTSPVSQCSRTSSTCWRHGPHWCAARADQPNC